METLLPVKWGDAYSDGYASDPRCGLWPFSKSWIQCFHGLDFGCRRQKQIWFHSNWVYRCRSTERETRDNKKNEIFTKYGAREGGGMGHYRYITYTYTYLSLFSSAGLLGEVVVGSWEGRRPSELAVLESEEIWGVSWVDADDPGKIGTLLNNAGEKSLSKRKRDSATDCLQWYRWVIILDVLECVFVTPCRAVRCREVWFFFSRLRFWSPPASLRGSAQYKQTCHLLKQTKWNIQSCHCNHLLEDLKAGILIHV